MYINLFLFAGLITTAYAKELSDSKVLEMFQHKPFCLDYGTTFGFKFLDLEKDIGKTGQILKFTTEKKFKDKPYPEKECIELKKGYRAFLVQKDICNAIIGFAPEKLKPEEAKYLLSKLHTFDAMEDSDKFYFNKDIVPFNVYKDEWSELAKTRQSVNILRYKDPDLKRRQEEYRNKYLALVEKTLKPLKITKNDFEKVEFGYAGCH